VRLRTKPRFIEANGAQSAPYEVYGQEY
jgi:hypothetical protein